MLKGGLRPDLRLVGTGALPSLFAPLRSLSLRFCCRRASRDSSNVFLLASMTDSSQASVHATRLGRQYVPVPAGPGAGELPIHDAISGLDSDTYARQIASTWRRQRIAAYLAALVNLPRIPRRILFQLVWQTACNKVAALRSLSAKASV